MSDTLTPRTRGWRDIHRYAYVARPYDEVWPWLAGHLSAIGEPLPDGGRSVEMRVSPAGMEINRPVRLRVAGLVCDAEAARAALGWVDAAHPLLFPTLRAVLEVVPVPNDTASFTQLGIRAKYRPPLGPVGLVGDRLLGAGITDVALTNFLDDLARAVEDGVAPPEIGRRPPPAPDPPGPGDPVVQRMFLTLDGLAVRKGGALAVAGALQSLPGVTHVSIDPEAGLAAVDHDPAQCGARRMIVEVERQTGE